MNHHLRVRQICWRLPTKIETRIESLENALFHSIQLLPEFLQTLLFGSVQNDDLVINLLWFISIGIVGFIFGFVVFSILLRRLRSIDELRQRCQQFQQKSHQIELKRAMLERTNEKLSIEIEQFKEKFIPENEKLRQTVLNSEKDVRDLQKLNETLQNDLRSERNRSKNVDLELQRQMDIVAELNQEILQLQEDLNKERVHLSRFRSNEISFERVEKDQKLIEQLTFELNQMKHDRSQHLRDLQEQLDQCRIDNKVLTETIEEYHQWIENASNIDENLRCLIKESQPIDEIQRSHQHLRHLYEEIERKTRQIDDLDQLAKSEIQRRRDLETKLEIVLELRERDAQIHLRQIDNFDEQWRQAKNDAERLRIVQSQLQLKQQKIENFEKQLLFKENRWMEESQKFQHSLHDKSMEIKRLTRDVQLARKEAESFRKQIAQYTLTVERLNDEKKRYESMMEDLRKMTPPPSHDDHHSFQPIEQPMHLPSPILRAPIFRPPFFPLFFRPTFSIPMTPHSPNNDEPSMQRLTKESH